MQKQIGVLAGARGPGGLVTLAAIAALVGAAVAPAYAGCDRVNQVMPRLAHLDEGTQKRLEFPTRIERVAVGDDGIADVAVVNDNEVLLTGTGGGLTSLYVWTACNPDAERSLVTVSAREALEVHEQEQSRDLVADLPMQVQADIRLVEVSRSKLRELGTSFLGRRGSSNFLFGTPGVVDGRGVPGGIAGASSGIPGSESGFNIFYGGGGDRFLSLINALESSDFAFTLAEPSLVALSGQSATFHAGGEFPVPVPSTGSDSVNIQFKEFGVRVSLTPTVINENQVVLKVAPEVSELDESAGVQVAGTTVPGIRVRRTDTTVSLGDGESFVISGLVSSSTASQVNRLPGLGEIPVLGAFFRNSMLEEGDRELLMIVTPHLVQPMSRDAALPALPGEQYRDYSPSAAEQFFLEDGSFEPFPRSIGDTRR
ncbi:type II and III secretion system protein family protein [Thioalkalivibrio sp. ALJT]|uniref:type II and III secretion system protein family protein n=1 Tax=Thioalkalivibrio sp. ALJT TaxID=1158146 RepID=UPI0003742751|nr:pilus assembly protein N-terminal domain-containing protein [Thioalkalivibrio sp. ALJT]